MEPISTVLWRGSPAAAKAPTVRQRRMHPLLGRLLAPLGYRPKAVTDAEDREEWDRAWGTARPRTAPVPLPGYQTPKELAGWGSVLSATVVLPPAAVSAEYASMATPPQSDTCPLCGISTASGQRLSGLLCPDYGNHRSFLVSVWLHSACYEGCPESEEKIIPW